MVNLSFKLFIFILNEKVCKKYDYWDAKIYKKRHKILKDSQGQKFFKTKFISYFDTEFLHVKMHAC